MWNVSLSDDGLAALVISIAMHVLSVLSFVFRLRRRQQQMGTGRNDLSICYSKLSDLYMFIAFLLCLGNSVAIWIEVGRGDSGSRHLLRRNGSSDRKPEDFLQTEYIVEVFYTLTNGATKLSIAHFFMELLPEVHNAQLRFRITEWLVIAWTIAFVFLGLFQCQPPDKAWKGDDVHGKCVDDSTFRIVQRALSLSLDTVLIFLPARLLWSFQDRSNRVSVFIMGWLGLAVCGVAIFWMAMYSRWMDDLTKEDKYQVLLWPTIELNLRIFYANLPLLFAASTGYTPSGHRD